MTIFKHSKYVQKEFDRLDDLINLNFPLSKPAKNPKRSFYSGTFEDKNGNVITVENGQIKMSK